ncbi:hypothetical protein RUND412_003744 [Rhizina undulata]
MPRLSGARPLQLQQWQGCSHKPIIGCTLSGATSCCACSDRRPHQETYELDRPSYSPDRSTSHQRWSGWGRSFYCGACKAFWERRILETRIRASVSRIPVYPSASTPPPSVPAPITTTTTITTSSTNNNTLLNPFDLSSRQTGTSSTGGEADSDSESSEAMDLDHPGTGDLLQGRDDMPSIHHHRGWRFPQGDSLQRSLFISGDPMRGSAHTRPRSWAATPHYAGNQNRPSVPESPLPDRMDLEWQSRNLSGFYEEYGGLGRHRAPSIIDSSERESFSWGRNEHSGASGRGGRGGRGSRGDRGSARGVGWRPSRVSVSVDYESESGRSLAERIRQSDIAIGQLEIGRERERDRIRERERAESAGRGRHTEGRDRHGDSIWDHMDTPIEQNRMMEDISRIHREMASEPPMALQLLEDVLNSRPNLASRRPSDGIRPRDRPHQSSSTSNYPPSFLRPDEALERARRIATTAGIRRPPAVRPRPMGLDENEKRPKPLENEQMKLECDCKICFGQIADVLVMPCRHLALCQWCADQMGIIKIAGKILPPVECPICRTIVNDRIQVFRC